MAMTAEQLGRAIVEAGILPADELRPIWESLGAARPKDGDGLAKVFVEKKMLTEFQAKQLLAGRGAALVLNQYLLLEKIGAGGMGQVFKARHRKMKRLVAIKLLPSALVKDKDAIRRFQREVEAAARLTHPNIVAAHDADESKGVHYLAMEFVDGKDLSATVKESGPLSVDEAINYITQAARGLAYAHSEGVVHRDIKPANLLLDKKGVVKILDMGLARLEDANAADQQLTNTGAVMGTVDYMAPEQATDTRLADARSDVYSLGCTLYRIATGDSVFEGDTVVRKIMAHMNTPVPSLCARCPAAPAELDRIFQKMMAKRPEDRYQNAGDLVADLETLRNPSASSSSVMQTSISHLSKSLADTGRSGLGSIGIGKTVDFDDGATAAFGQQKLKSLELGGVTMNGPAAEIDTDPKSFADLKPPRKNNLTVILAAGGAAFVLLLLGVIVVIKNDKGEPVAEIKVADGTTTEVKPPPGGSVEIRSSTSPAAGSAPPPSTTAAAPPKAVTTFKSPHFILWQRGVEKSSPPEQLQAVAKKLQELNPGFDGKLYGTASGGSPVIRDDQVTELAIYTTSVSDVSPVRALTALKRLTFIGGKDSQGQLEDLSPLQGMSLVDLNIDGNRKLSDLTPLVGMPLTRFSCTGTAITALAPLKAMSLDSLRCGSGPLADLTPLAGMKLSHLNVSGSKVTDLSPLRGMPLKTFGCGLSKLSDLIPLSDCRELITVNVTSSGVTSDAVAALQQALPNCKIEWDGAKPSATKLAFRDPAFQKWVQQTQTLSAEKQLEAVRRKLMDLNPGFDGELMGQENFYPRGAPKVQNGVVTELAFFANNVTDLSPLQVLKGLKVLVCTGREGVQGDILADLSPLQGMALEQLSCFSTKVADLTPLQGMPLRVLLLAVTPVADIAPLRGMPLKDVNISTTRVASLEPLRGAKLESLRCYSSPIASLAPLTGMPLKSLYTGNTKVSDISMLGDMPLGILWLENMAVSDVTPLHRCQTLYWLKITDTKISPAGIEALKKALPKCKIEWNDPAKAPAKKLAYLDPAFQQWVADTQKLPAEQQIEAVSKKLIELNPRFDGKLYGQNQKGTPIIENGVVIHCDFFVQHVTDISPIRAFSGLNTLGCVSNAETGSRLADISPLSGMQLKKLGINRTQVIDLSALVGMRLSIFECSYTKVSDLSVLQGMPLRRLYCNGCDVTDFTPIVDCKTLGTLHIKYIKVTPAQIAELQKALPSCEIEWDDPTKAAKPKLAYLDPAFQQWVVDTQKLPAEQQIDAVSKKLMELNPGFDGKLTNYGRKDSPAIENGSVTTVGMVSDEVTDISPLQVFQQLKSLNCNASAQYKGRLADLSPLMGLRLVRLEIVSTQVTDLAALRGMPLEFLDIAETRVSNLSPLQGMPLDTLHVNHNHRITDISPLRGLPLKKLRLFTTDVTDLSPLTECGNLRTLDIHVACKNITAAQVAALQKALPNCKIEWDDPAKAAVPDKAATSEPRTSVTGTTSLPLPNGRGSENLHWKSPEFQKWVADTQKLPAEKQVEAVSKKLQELNPKFTAPLQSKIENGVVTELKFRSNDVTNIAPVRALVGLNTLAWLGEMNANVLQLPEIDISPLKGMPLTKLGCVHLPISDLSPLEGMPLKSLNCNHSRVSDLTPLRGMPLEEFTCGQTAVSDLSPLRECQKLQFVDATQTKVNADGVAQLRDVLPNCVIDWDDPAKPGLWRNIAIWVIERGGKVWIGKNHDIAKVEDLPATISNIAVVKFEDLKTIGDDEAAVIGRWPVSTSFAFSNTSITDAGFRHIARVQRWGSLSLKGTGITGEGFDAFAGKGLGTLVIQNARFSDAGWQAVSQIGGTAIWYVESSNINDARLREIIQRHPEIEALHASTTGLTDTSTEDIAKLPNLAYAGLDKTKITDGGLRHLFGAKELKKVSLKKTTITAVGVAALQKALPNCKIEWDGSPPVSESTAPKSPQPTAAGTK